MDGYELRMFPGCGKEFRDGWLRAMNGGWGLTIRTQTKWWLDVVRSSQEGGYELRMTACNVR
jgi:hypothetical protein